MKLEPQLANLYDIRGMTQMRYHVYQVLQCKNIEDKEAVLDIIEGILTILDEKDVLLKKAKGAVNDFTAADNAVYYDRKYLYIPERILKEILGDICYMDIPDQVSLLKAARYDYKRIIPEAFYTEVSVSNPIGGQTVDCLTLNYKVIRTIRMDMDYKED